jgi:hypothetical protein
VTESTTGQVECYAGASYPTEPRAVWWAGQRYSVVQVLARWMTPTGPGWRVEAEAGASFQLHYQTTADRWQIRRLDTGTRANHEEVVLL